MGKITSFFALVMLFVSGCAGTEKIARDSSGRLIVPDWYKVRFILYYPDGRKYVGDCAWPKDYDRILAFDIRTAEGLRKPGKVVRSVREVHGPRVHKFVPHGHGTMIYPDGTRKCGLWRRGRYVGETQKE